MRAQRRRVAVGFLVGFDCAIFLIAAAVAGVVLTSAPGRDAFHKLIFVSIVVILTSTAFLASLVQLLTRIDDVGISQPRLRRVLLRRVLIRWEEIVYCSVFDRRRDVVVGATDGRIISIMTELWEYPSLIEVFKSAQMSEAVRESLRKLGATSS